VSSSVRTAVRDDVNAEAFAALARLEGARTALGKAWRRLAR
jgi:hypothetical protein